MEALIAISMYLKDRGYDATLCNDVESTPIRTLYGETKHIVSRAHCRIDILLNKALLATITAAPIRYKITCKSLSNYEAETVDIHDPDSFNKITKFIDKAMDVRFREWARADYIASCEGGRNED